MNDTTTSWYDAVTNETAGEFGELINSNASTVVIKDTQLQSRGTQARGQLRSVPLFHLFGIERMCHTDVWDSQLKLIEYESISTESVEDVGDVSFPLVHIVTQDGIDEHGEESLLRGLVERSVKEDGRYILVTDTAAPRTPSFTKKPGKSIVDEFASITVQSYDHLSSSVLGRYLGSKLPAADTRSLFFHVASTLHHRQGAPAASLEELFDYSQAPPNSPVWGVAERVLHQYSEPLEGEDIDRIQSALDLWIEQGGSYSIADQIVDTLRVCEHDQEQFEAYRKQKPKNR